MSVDLPALGAPISAMKPQRVSSVAAAADSGIDGVRRHSLARQHGGGSGLLRGAFRSADPLGRRALEQFDRHAELRAVVRAGALDLAVGRRRHAARLRPLLQQRLRVTQRTRRLDHALLPIALDQRGGPPVAAVDEQRADQRLANIREDRGAPMAAGLDFRVAEPHRRTEVDRARDIGAGLLAHERGEAPRQLAFGCRREGAEQHVGNNEAEHMIAKKLEPLIAAAAVAPAGKRRAMGERAVEPRMIGEAVADAILEFGDLAGGRADTFAAARRGAAALGCALGTRGAALSFGGIGFRRPVAHRTIVNSRSQRTDHGQRQNAQPRSPSWTEKKMISARTTMFSNGTKPTCEVRLSCELSRLSPIMK